MLCPACLSHGAQEVRRFTAEESAQHFVLVEQDERRHLSLRDKIRSLWRRDYCVIVQCTSCGFRFADPYVSGDEVFYNLAFPRASYPKSRWEYGRSIKTFNGCRPRRVLEIGAGRGYFLDLLGAESSTALEFNDLARSELSAKGYASSPSDIRTFKADPFEAIFMFQVLEHMADLDAVISNISNLSCGSVFVSVPNLVRTIFQENHGGLYDMPPNHIGGWTPTALKAAWARHGFRIVEEEYEPHDLTQLIAQDLSYRILKLAQKHGSIANHLRSMPRGVARKAGEIAFALAISPARISTLAAALIQREKLGPALWVRLSREH